MRRVTGGVVGSVLLMILAAGVAVLRSADGSGEVGGAGLRRVITVGPKVVAVVCGRPIRHSDLLIDGDFDGDGRLDKAFEYEPGAGQLVLGMCLADGRSDEVEIGTAEGSFRAADLDGDGRDEIIYGGTTVWQQIDMFAVVVDGHIRLVDGPGLASGPLDADDSGQAWGCEDVDGDGSREVLQVTVVHDGPVARWTKESFRLDPPALPLLNTTAGETQAWSVPSQQAATLIGRC